jgi:hypothetical protein
MRRVVEWLQSFPGELPFLALLAAAIGVVCAWMAVMHAPGAWLGGVFIGALFVLYAGAILRRLVVVKRWPVVGAQVLRAEPEEVLVSNDGDGDPREWRPLVVYQYQLAGHTYRSRRFAVELNGFLGPKRGDAKNILLSYTPGAHVSVHVCPTQPSWSVLAVSLSSRRRSHTAAVLTGGLLVMAISFWVGWVS